MGKLYSQKRKNEAETLPWYHTVLLWLAWATAIIFLLMGYYLPKYGTVYAVFTFFFGAISIIMVFITSILNVMEIEPKIQNFDTMVQEHVKEYFDVLNRTSFRKRGMEW